MSDEAGRQALLANMRAQFVRDGGGGYVMGGGYQVAYICIYTYIYVYSMYIYVYVYTHIS